MQRGRGKKKTDKTMFRYQFVGMGLVLFFSYSFLVIVSHVFGMFRDGVDVLNPESRDLQRIVMYIWPFDPELANFADDVNQLLDAYVAEENIFQTQRDRLDRVWEYAATQRERLIKLGFHKYYDLLATLESLYLYRDEVYQLMGSEQPFTYLIALQNTGEKRPNGGFFGSFVVLTIDQGQIVTFQPVDSYFPDSIAKGFRVPGQPWGAAFLSDNKVSFVGGNKYGFTDMDGRNLKNLYEKIFNELYDISTVQSGPYANVWPSLTNKYIKGVIFLRSDMIEDMIPGFEQRTRERQFVNATIDLIRGESRTNKKELYMKDMTAYFEKNRTRLVLGLLGQMDDLRKKHRVNIFLSNVSQGLQNRLQQWHFTTVYDKNNLYLWDYNRSYSKVDRFVTKEVIVRRGGQVVGEYVDQDILSVRDWESGSYVLDIYYQVNIPQSYRDAIAGFAERYGVKLTERELSILHLQSNFAGVLWSTQGVIHMPGRRIVDDISGDVFDIIDDYSDLGHFVSYRAESPFNNSTSHISLSITIP